MHSVPSPYPSAPADVRPRPFDAWTEWQPEPDDDPGFPPFSLAASRVRDELTEAALEEDLALVGIP